MSFEEWYDQHFGSADPNVVKAGNIDLGDRPAVYNEDGTVSTERSFSIGDEYGRETLIPQVVGGKMLSKKDAIKHYRETGEHLGIYKDIPTANAYADAIHNRTPRLDTPETFPAGNLFQSVRDLPGWAAYRMYRGATRNDLPGEGPSAREQEAAGVIPPPYQLGSFSVDNARANLRDIKNAILPPGFSVQRGLDSALAPAKWLFNEVRQGVLPDEAIEEIKRNPYSPRSIEYMTQAAISLSGGKGGREVPMGPRPVPRRVWDMWNPTDHPGVKVDEMGNHYEATGTHYDKATGESHIVVKPTAPVPPPEGTSTGISPKEAPPGTDLLKKTIGDAYDAAGKSYNPTTWEELTPWQKEWFENQWKLGNSPSMKDVPAEGTGFGSGLVKPEDWQDNPFQKFMEKTYPGGTSGPFPDPETLPPGELSKPSEPLKPEPGSAMDDLQKSQELQKAVEDWKKKHGGLNPFEPPPSVGDDFPEMPPGVTPEDYWNQNKPEGAGKYWDNLNDPKYWDRKDSGPLTGQAWADIYATPDVEFTVGPKKPAEPGTPEYLDETLDIFKNFADKYGVEPYSPPPSDYPSGTILPPDPGESPADWWKRYTYHRTWHHPGDKSFPEPPTGPTKTPKPPANWDDLSPEQRQAWFDRWKPPEHGGNNL